MTGLNDADREKIQEHLKAVPKILYQNTPSDKLKTFEKIETTLREQIREEISPGIAKFFLRKLAQ
ncbi:MAG: hypothetical protein GPJ00_21050 [Microcystis aeruginosa W13-18]|jgi:hypothetical protein|nr:hypothetical protein [Microcystis aeruginosa W13-18]NCR37737.1 hypothetical protein [Microcystis aeruginosa S11-05]NCR51243.1 hypothetical protein [Microcystis aeruginosa S11-01]NCS50074.1 hypothetical protein [Microcystis aeruginosa BK11-02]NCS78814.1 hypothetical protein [Microcystis aeruginosa K13-07]